VIAGRTAGIRTTLFPPLFSALFLPLFLPFLVDAHV